MIDFNSLCAAFGSIFPAARDSRVGGAMMDSIVGAALNSNPRKRVSSSAASLAGLLALAFCSPA